MKQSLRILHPLLISSLLISSSFLRAGADDLRSFYPCILEPMKGADGDSFRVKFPDGHSKVIRLYAVDCIEANIWDAADGRRLREQRRFFGISDCRSTLLESINEAKFFGQLATQEVESLLQRPFTVHTVFADGQGSGYHKRFYGFVTTAEGEDLGTLLVTKGLARAFGVFRRSPDGLSQKDLEKKLKDLELKAAGQRVGIWKLTNFDTIDTERALQRIEDAEIATAIEKNKSSKIVDPNTAPRDDLMSLPGIGETLALRIIENRPYRDSKDLLAVKSLGPATLKRFQHRLPEPFRIAE